MVPKTLTTPHRILLQRALATLRAVEYWFWQLRTEVSEPVPEAHMPDYAPLLAVLLRLEVARIERLLLAADINRDSGGGRIHPHTAACRANHMAVVAAITNLVRAHGQGDRQLLRIPYCECEDTG